MTAPGFAVRFSPVSWVLRELGSALDSWGASEASNGSVALGTAGFFLGGLSDALASVTNPIGSLWNLGEASYTVAQRDGDVAGVAYGLGSLIGATQATEAVEGENFLTGQALTGLDRWGVAFQSISAASGVAAVGVSIAGIDSPLDFSGWFRRTAEESEALIPRTFARVVPGNISPTTLGVTDQVFVTDAASLRGLNAGQIAAKLEIPAAASFKVIEFASEGVNGFAVPIRNASPGFVGNGFTSGGLPEFVVPNGPIPSGSAIRSVR